MCDKEKFSRLMPYTFATFSDVDYFISDDAVPEAVLAALKAGNTTLL